MLDQPTGNDKNRFETYHVIARLLHWVMAFAIILAMILAIFREEFKDAFEWRSMGLHKSLGLLVLGLAVVRLGWRAKNPPPPMESSINPGIQRLAHLAHILFYVLMIALPILGYTISSAGSYPLDFFGIPVGKLPIDKDSWFVGPAGSAHVVGGYTMAALIIGHAGAALYHHFILKDRTLLRMVPDRPT